MPTLTDQQIDSASDAEALVRLLADADYDVPPRLRERILSFGPAVVPPLVDLVNTILTDIDEPSESPEAMHAVELLTELRAPEAVEPLLRVLRDTQWDTHVHDLILRQLPRIGAPALEPTLAAHDAATDPDVIDDFCTILASLKVRDERIYERLVAELERNVELGAMNLAEYGDPRALPHLSAALDRFELVDSPDLMANHPPIELEAAIQDLGGELTSEQSRKASQARARGRLNSQRLDALLKQAVSHADLDTSSAPRARAALAEPRPARAARKVGRNDPCPCGSGKKYKKCCLRKE